ncbi:NAD/NADP octopine/nopaline dehydrogenase family protein [Actinokineospora guangxiensis]|uniref:NAD/NADP octopine/nopaline dehydrogenase family protein n=1 Tax=Actinokineospora guangxiensis TaxID=1490288 RepID=A0ABW0EUN0_9PSEU
MSGNGEPAVVVGAGGEGLALAAHLSAAGHPVSLCTRHPDRIAAIRDTRRIRARGAIDGEFALSAVTADAHETVTGARLVFIATVTTAYAEVAARLAPTLTPEHIVVLFSSKLCGSAAFTAALAAAAGTGLPDVVETDALFAARPDGDHGVRVLGRKRWTLFSGLSQSATARHAELMRRLFPGVEPARHMVERGLVDFGAVAHAPIALANLAGIDRGERVLFYREGLSERTVVLLEQVGREFADVASAYGARVPAPARLLELYYGCEDSTDVLRAMSGVVPYQDIRSPASLDHRFLHEDVSCTLVPLIGLAERAGVPVPMVEAVVTFASVLAGKDYRREGRTLDRLGWANLTAAEIMDRLQR